MTPDLDQAVEQVRNVLYENCEGRFDERAIVEALLAAGWRPPPEVMSEEPWIKRPDGSSFRRGYINYRMMS